MKSYNGFSPKQRMDGDKIIKQAINDGILEPLTTATCVLCGQDKGIRHYHCEDYSPSNILNDAICLCWRCHMIVHSRFRCPNQYENYLAAVKSGQTFEPVYYHDFSILLRDHNIK